MPHRMSLVTEAPRRVAAVLASARSTDQGAGLSARRAHDRASVAPVLKQRFQVWGLPSYSPASNPEKGVRDTKAGSREKWLLGFRFKLYGSGEFGTCSRLSCFVSCCGPV